MTDQNPASVNQDSLPKGIVFFDYDGVLNQGSSWRAVHEALGTLAAADKQYDRYHANEITFTEWGQLDASLWKGRPAERFYEATKNIKLINNIKKTVASLKERGYVTGVVSGGVSQLIEATVGECGFDFIIANEVRIEDELITGDVTMKVVNTKHEYYRCLADQYDMSLSRSVTIGDSEDDFQPVEQGLNIAFNADGTATQNAADVVVKAADLNCILPIIEKWRTNEFATNATSDAAGEFESLLNTDVEDAATTDANADE